MLALWFLAPWLLTGLLAGGIPILLHLLSNTVARPEPFPTLRFLHQSMERTAVRRRLQHWLLMALRVAALMLLAMALAEPISRAAGVSAGGHQAAAIVLDTSLSMRAASGSITRFESARTQAETLLGSRRRPASAAVLLTGLQETPDAPTASLDVPRQALTTARCSAGEGNLAPKIEKALAVLQAQSLPQKLLCIFTDLPQPQAAAVAKLPAWAQAADVQVVIVNVAQRPSENLAVTDLTVAGPPVVGAKIELAATVRNFGPEDRTVDVSLDAPGSTLPPRRILLSAAGRDGCEARLRFDHHFVREGPATCAVSLSRPPTGPAKATAPLDDLPNDDMRRVTLLIGSRAHALIVSGPEGTEPAMAPAWMLARALNPYGEGEHPWPIVTRRVAANALTDGGLRWAHAVFLANVPAPTAAEAAALTAFVRSGATVMIFLGPDIDAARYNTTLAEVLPATLGAATGQVGPAAAARTVTEIDAEHPYFSWLTAASKRLRPVTVQRYFRLENLDPSARVLMRLDDGQPLLVERTFPSGGRVVLCATTASPKWTDLPVTPVLLPLVERATVLAPREARTHTTFVCGQPVVIEPGSAPAAASVQVHPPAGDASAVATIPLASTPRGPAARFDGADQLGTYRWYVTGRGLGADGASGEFSVNPPPAESDLATSDEQALAAALREQGVRNVYVGRNLDEALASMDAAATGRNWWDLVLVCVVLVLLVEGVIANMGFSRRT